MRILQSLVFLTLCITANNHALSQLTISGIYSGKNIYLQNPMDENGFDHCTESIQVNGNEYEIDFSSSAFEIKLDAFNLEIGDSVNIKINHKRGCKPIVLNGGCVIPPRTGSIKTIDSYKNGELKREVCTEVNG